jgi:Predicted membrane protein
MKKAIAGFISTPDDIGVFVARVMLSIVFIPHGSQKLLGLFGGYGFTGTMESFASNGMPAVLAFLIIMAESLGSLALLFGFFGRFMAFGIGMVMLGAILMVHLPNGFFMNWFGTQKGEGFEYHLLAIGLALVVMIKGSGAFSVDRLLHKHLTQ